MLAGREHELDSLSIDVNFLLRVIFVLAFESGHPLAFGLFSNPPRLILLLIAITK